MHGLLRVGGWVVIMLSILWITGQIPKEENVFRTVMALTFLLWFVVGAAYGLRGVYRFVVSRGQ